MRKMREKEKLYKIIATIKKYPEEKILKTKTSKLADIFQTA